jgi:hypothetical protein
MTSTFLSEIIKSNTTNINFCEPDNPNGFVFEYFNTMSSLVFVILGIYGVKSNEQLNKIILYYILIAVGLLSAYYHAVISELSHIMDILSISMILSTSVYCIEKSSFNKKTQQEDFIIGIRYGIEMLIYTILAFISPLFHIIMEFYEGYRLKQIVEKRIYDIKINKILNDNETNKLIQKYNICKWTFITSIILWMIDYFLCDLLNGYHLHWIFHIMIAIMSYNLIELLDYIGKKILI